MIYIADNFITLLYILQMISMETLLYNVVLRQGEDRTRSASFACHVESAHVNMSVV